MKTNKPSSDSNDFSGFSDWVEIFAGGRQTDSSGVEHDADALIDLAVSTFDPSYHEPPAVLGHPKDDAPAYGWVKSLKTDVKTGVKRLYAKFRQVVPEFEEMVKSGQFKKRSASFYPDGRLRHVGWLGAMPPAVKGLADVAFNDDDESIRFEFIDTRNPTGKETKMKFSEFLEAFKFWKKVQNDPDADLGDFAAPTAPKQPGKSFSEADLEAARVEAAESARKEGKKEAAAEFAEAESKRKKAEAKAKIRTIVDEGIKQGKIAPAWKDAGLAEFMESLDVEQKIEFGEGDAKEKKTGLDWFADFLEGLPKFIDFDEIAGRDKDMKTGAAGEKLEALIRKKQAADKNLSYTAAFAEVQVEHPDLVAEYQQDLS